MQTSSPEFHPSRWLARAGLVSALAMLLLSVGIPPLAAQSYNFNNQSDAAWSHYDLGITVTEPPGGYPPNIYSFPTNPAGPAGNYAYRMQIPVYTNDPFYYLYPRGGSFLTGANFGNINDSTGGRFLVGADLLAWNTTWSDMEIGVAWDASVPNLYLPSAYLAGWGPGQKTLGCGVIINGTSSVGLIGLVDPYSTVLQTDHQYRMAASSHDGVTFLVQIFDLAQPNSPWQSVITADNSLGDNGAGGGGGTVGILGADLLSHGITASNTEGADATWDNFSVSAPAFVDPAGSVPAVMPATVTDLSPPPAGQAVAPLLAIGFMNRDTGVNSSSNPNGWIKLYLDGVQIPNNQLTIDPNLVYKLHNNDQTDFKGPHFPYPTNFPGATVSWVITNKLAWGSVHTTTVVFEDDQTLNGHNVLHTNTWSWTVAFLSRFADSGALSARGFDTRLVQSYSTSSDPAVYTNYANIACAETDPKITPWEAFGNSVAGAQAVLNYQYTVSYAATNLVQTVNFDRNTTDDQMFNGNALTNFPGLCLPAGDAYVNSFAVEVLAYLQLPAGTNNFYVDSDDAVAVYTGTNLTDTSTVLLHNDGVTHQSFDWVVVAAGLYPVHIVMEEGWGGAYLALCTLNRTAGTTNLVNTPGSNVQAYYPLACLSSTSAKGPFTFDAAANAGNVLQTSPSYCQSGAGALTNLTVTGGTMTFPLPSAPKYYRLDGPRKTRFTGATKSGSNLVISYQAY